MMKHVLMTVLTPRILVEDAAPTPVSLRQFVSEPTVSFFQARRQALLPEDLIYHCQGWCLQRVHGLVFQRCSQGVHGLLHAAVLPARQSSPQSFDCTFSFGLSFGLALDFSLCCKLCCKLCRDRLVVPNFSLRLKLCRDRQT